MPPTPQLVIQQLSYCEGGAIPGQLKGTATRPSSSSRAGTRLQPGQSSQAFFSATAPSLTTEELLAPQESRPHAQLGGRRQRRAPPLSCLPSCFHLGLWHFPRWGRPGPLRIYIKFTVCAPTCVLPRCLGEGRQATVSTHRRFPCPAPALGSRMGQPCGKEGLAGHHGALRRATVGGKSDSHTYPALLTCRMIHQSPREGVDTTRGLHAATSPPSNLGLNSPLLGSPPAPSAWLR